MAALRHGMSKANGRSSRHLAQGGERRCGDTCALTPMSSVRARARNRRARADGSSAVPSVTGGTY